MGVDKKCLMASAPFVEEKTQATISNLHPNVQNIFFSFHIFIWK